MMWLQTLGKILRKKKQKMPEIITSHDVFLPFFRVARLQNKTSP